MNPTQFKALWATTQAHHQAGRLPEAERGYREVLRQMPEHFDALHLLGVVALQTGRLEEAESCIRRALSVDGKSAAAHSNLGNVHLRRGELASARSAFQRAIQLQPSLGDAHFNLAQVLRREGRTDEALTHLRRAVSLNARSPAMQSSLGAALREMGDVAGAIKAFERAAQLQPTAEALSNLGAVLCAQGQLERAEQVLRRALATDPQSAQPRANLGNVLASLGRTAEAIEQFRAALGRTPQAVEALSNLGGALREAGQLDEAIELLRRAVAIDPTFAEARSNLAQALAERGDLEAASHLERMQETPSQASAAFLLQGSISLGKEDFAAAEAAYRRAADLAPSDAKAPLGLGHSLMGQGRASDARAAYQRAIDLNAELSSARWSLAMARLDPIPQDAATAQASRASFARALAQLDRWFDPTRVITGHHAVGSTQPFYLAYQAQANRELLKTYGRLCARLMRHWQSAQGIAAPSGTKPRSGRAVRVGFATAHVRDHSVWNAIVKGWVDGLDPQRFELFLYHLGAFEDAQTQWAKRRVARFFDGRKTLAQWATTIAGHELDVLIYPEIGMHSLTTRLASLRLSPLQAASWGHPETTGLPTIDAFLSAALLEPPGGDGHYSERLVRLANLGVYLEPSRDAPLLPDLRALGLPVDKPLLLCPGMPFKYQPEHDSVWIDIARRLPDARLVFFRAGAGELAARLAARLEARFSKEGMRLHEHVCFIPFLDRPRFFGLMQRARLYLDTIGFSGFNTALQALECGLPMVTVEGEFMRGRLASALLRRLGLDELVVSDGQAFADTVVRLARDADALARLRSDIKAWAPTLFADRRPLADLENFLLAAAE